VRLSADICGIMLLEDDALVMMRCTGTFPRKWHRFECVPDKALVDTF